MRDARGRATLGVMLTLYDQTTYSDKDAGTFGDCVRACVLTILQRSEVRLPHPIASEDQWNQEFFEVLENVYGLELHHAPYRPEKDYSFLPRVLAVGGPTERGTSHMVVWDREAHRMIHDPHPSRAGILSITDIWDLRLNETRELR